VITDYLADLPDIDYPDFRKYFEDITSRYGGRTALRMKKREGQDYDTWTYRDLKSDVNAVRSYLLKNGLRQGDRVAVFSENRPEWCVTYLAAVVQGLVIVPVDEQLAKEEARSMVERSGARVLFFSARACDKIRVFTSRNILLVCFDAEGEKTGADGYTRIIDSASDGEPDGWNGDGNDTAALIFTSGTTGVSKPVELTHRNIITNVNASIQSLPIDENDVFIAVLPLHHTYPTTCSFLSPLAVGGSITIAESLAGKKILANIRETGGTVLIGVPLLYDKIRRGMKQRFKELPALKRTSLSLLMRFSGACAAIRVKGAGKVLLKKVRESAGLTTMRLLVSGGGALGFDTARFFESLGFSIVQGYGMSENGPLISVNTVRYNRHRSVGLAVKNTEIRIEGSGTGEILVRSPSVMKGYYGDDEATAEVLNGDGFLRTGDVGRIDRRGFLHITGRIKNVIVTHGGKNVYPEEIEARFNESSVIGEILVVGRRQHGRGEEVVAVCVPDFESLSARYTEGELTPGLLENLVRAEVSAVNKTLPGYKRIKDVLIRKIDFEKTSSKKIKRYLYTAYADAPLS